VRFFTEGLESMATAQTIRGYELHERIGAGGFGEVYRAYQPSVGREVAIKVILPQFANEPDFIRRFDKEAQLVARLEHPHIVPLYDYWRDPDGAYLVMRWLRGGNLCASLETGPWPPDAAARLLDQIAGAITVAHRQGVVHRDVKPENIMLDEEGNAYLTDFGIAKDLLLATGTTAADAVPGSVAYVSPEQVQGRPITPQSDIYSLGLVMHEILTGEYPFAGLTPGEQLVRRLTEPLPSLQERRSDLPAALDVVVQRATDKDPVRRYPDALAFASAFREALATPVAPEVESRLRPPVFLGADAETQREEVPRPVFVARERELERLDEFLQMALRGEGRVVFVTGGPGRGKTALIDEFARRAMEAHPDLLVASGNSNAYSGVGDPYLPFRDIMGLLTGDVEARWTAGTITREHAWRLWAGLPLAAQALMNHGPHLIDVFFPGPALLSRATTAAPEGAPWLGQLRAYVERQRVSSTGLEQSHLFQQFTNVLYTLAEQRPLLLVLDDLQWADSASIGLLFHLGRRLKGGRILIACAYRPEEVALDRDGERHPLEKALAEFKRRFGDVWVDLGQVEEREGREFVDAFLESEPNRLGEGFRRALFQHTGGHPLFTIELLLGMQERGDLVQDKHGRWVAGPALDWETLPARVEGVIEERVGRLEEELRDTLSVASVEGEEFTAQAVARVQEISERQLLRALSQELEKRHRLVREHGELVVAHQRLSRYRFAHALFQQYLYNDLSAGERRMLHRQIAVVLEELYAGSTGEIAVQLTRHYGGAGDTERERHYARLAGERAAAGYANAEALRYLSRALDLTPKTDIAARCAILLVREKVHDLQAAREAQTQDLAALEALAEATDDERLRVEVGLRQAGYYTQVTWDYPTAIAAAQKAIRLAQAAQYVGGEAAGRFWWGRALLGQGDYDAARFQLEQGLALARAAGSRQVEADSLRNLGYVCLNQRDGSGARAHYEQALAIHREIGDRRGEWVALNNLAYDFAYQGDYFAAVAYMERSLHVSREIGDRLGEASVLNKFGDMSRGQGDYAEARPYLEQSVRVAREIGDRGMEALALYNLSVINLLLGNYANATTYSQQSLRICREIGNQGLESFALWHLSHALKSQGDYAKATIHLHQSLPTFRKFGNRLGEFVTLALLGLCLHYQGDDRVAQEYVQQALPIAWDYPDHDIQAHILTYLGHALADLGYHLTLHPELDKREAHERLAEAADVYQQALDIRRTLGRVKPTTEPLAGLALVSLAQGDLSQAQAQVEEILSYLEHGILDGTAEPFRVYLTCYRILRANQDSRAGEVLDTAHRLLQEQADTIEGEQLRRSFLENVAAHREIVEAWEEAQTPPQRNGLRNHSR